MIPMSLDSIAEDIGTVTEEQEHETFGRGAVDGSSEDLPVQQRNPDEDDYGL